MLANYGYADASGSYFITIDTDRCDGCGKCVDACPASCFEDLAQDPNDPFRDVPVVVVADGKRKMLKYACAPCKPAAKPPSLPCVDACPQDAVIHSW